MTAKSASFRDHGALETMGRKRILFFSESVTLAQVVRLVSLARSLDPERFEIHFASAEFDPLVFRGTDFVRHPVWSVDARVIDSRLRWGRRLYDKRTLCRYVEEDVAVIRRVKPDLIVGDFRLSLATSAEIEKTPLAALINAYWSPFAVRDGFPMPEHPIVALLGEKRASDHFSKALPFVFDHFARPVNALRKHYGLRSAGSLLEVLTQGDWVLYADSPGLVPTAKAPPHHEYLGPVTWAPEGTLPGDFAALASERALIYVTLGSSGSTRALPIVLDALAELPVSVLCATAGKKAPSRVPANAVVVDFVPGDAAARIASIVISNGGSSTGYQALAEGKPVIGIAANMDQYLAMTAIARAGAGRLLRAGTLDRDMVQRAVADFLDAPAPRAAARAVQGEFRRFPYRERFPVFVERALTLGTPDRFRVGD